MRSWAVGPPARRVDPGLRPGRPLPCRRRHSRRRGAGFLHHGGVKGAGVDTFTVIYHASGDTEEDVGLGVLMWPSASCPRCCQEVSLVARVSSPIVVAGGGSRLLLPAS